MTIERVRMMNQENRIIESQNGKPSLGKVLWKLTRPHTLTAYLENKYSK